MAEIEKDPEKAKALFDALWSRFHEQVLKPHAEGISRLIARGDVVITIFEPGNVALDTLRHLGWDGERPYFRMSNRVRKNLAKNLAEDWGDLAAAKWLNTRREGRIFAIIHDSTFCINFVPGEGYTFEPGTNDSERAQTLN